MSEPAIQKALSAEEVFLQRDKERYLYEMREKALHDYVSAMNAATEKGLAEGREEGLLPGLAAGLAEGHAEGEMSAKQALARNMLKANLPLQQIIDITGFSKEDLEKL